MFNIKKFKQVCDTIRKNVYLHIDEYQVHTTDLNGCVKYTIQIDSYTAMENIVYFILKIKNNKGQEKWASTDCFLHIPQELHSIPTVSYFTIENGIMKDILQETFPIYMKKYLDKNSLKKRIIYMNGV